MSLIIDQYCLFVYELESGYIFPEYDQVEAFPGMIRGVSLKLSCCHLASMIRRHSGDFPEFSAVAVTNAHNVWLRVRFRGHENADGVACYCTVLAGRR